jgi:hypothetical protein
VRTSARGRSGYSFRERCWAFLTGTMLPPRATEVPQTSIQSSVPTPDGSQTARPYRKRADRVSRRLADSLAGLVGAVLVAIIFSLQAGPGAGSPGATRSAPPPGRSAEAASPTPVTGIRGPFPEFVQVSAMKVLRSENISNLSTGTERMRGITYDHSVAFTCGLGYPAGFAYDVAGQQSLNTVIGVPGNAVHAAGNAMTITFFADGVRPLGRPITVSLDHSTYVKVNITGATVLEIACRAFSLTSHLPVAMGAALGGPTVGSLGNSV